MSTLAYRMARSVSVPEFSFGMSVSLGVLGPTKGRGREKEMLHYTDMAHAHECTFCIGVKQGSNEFPFDHGLLLRCPMMHTRPPQSFKPKGQAKIYDSIFGRFRPQSSNIYRGKILNYGYHEDILWIYLRRRKRCSLTKGVKLEEFSLMRK